MCPFNADSLLGPECTMYIYMCLHTYMYVCLCIIEIPKMHKSYNTDNYMYKTTINNHCKVVNVNVHYPL